MTEVRARFPDLRRPTGTTPHVPCPYRILHAVYGSCASRSPLCTLYGPFKVYIINPPHLPHSNTDTNTNTDTDTDTNTNTNTNTDRRR
jgi:hypothetical protein